MGESSSKQLRVIGIDDWAWRKGQSYGTVLVDLEGRRVADLLPERSAEQVARWLAHQGMIVAQRSLVDQALQGRSSAAPFGEKCQRDREADWDQSQAGE